MKAQIPELLRQSLEAFTTDSSISRETVDEVISHHAVITNPKGSTLVLMGPPADFFSWISSGTVEVFYQPSDSSRILVRLCSSGDVLGHVDFIDYKKRRVQVLEAFARTKCEVTLVTPEHIFKPLQALESEQFIGLLEYLNTAWSSVVSSWATFIGLNYRRRLEKVLTDLSSRFSVEGSRGTAIITELRHEKFAEMIGSSRPFITRLICDTVKQAVLARRGIQYILFHPP